MAAYVKAEQAASSATRAAPGLPGVDTEPMPAATVRLLIGRDMHVATTLPGRDIADQDTVPLPVVRPKSVHLPMLWWSPVFLVSGWLSLLVHHDQWFSAAELVCMVCIGLWLVDVLLTLFRERTSAGKPALVRAHVVGDERVARRMEKEFKVEQRTALQEWEDWYRRTGGLTSDLCSKSEIRTNGHIDGRMCR